MAGPQPGKELWRAAWQMQVRREYGHECFVAILMLATRLGQAPERPPGATDPTEDPKMQAGDCR